MKKLALLFSIIVLASGSCFAQMTGFTYQGKLSSGGSPATGNYDLQFSLFDNASGGTQVATTQTFSSVGVSGGTFKVQLDFGQAAFLAGTDRWLEISARLSGVGSFIPLAPRQQVTSTPYAVQSLNSASASLATNSLQLGGVAAGQFVQMTASGSVGIGTPAPGFKLHVTDSSNTGLRVQTNSSGGTVASFGGLGDFRIDGSGLAGGRLNVTEAGNVGIGNNNPSSKLTVAGTIESTAGGIKFPDGTVQTTAPVGANITYTTIAGPIHERVPSEFLGINFIRHLALPNGLYLVETTVQFQNLDAIGFQAVECNFINDPLTFFTRIAETSADLTQSFHSVMNVTQGQVAFRCHASDFNIFPPYRQSAVYVQEIRLTAVRLGPTVVVQ